MTDQTCGDCLFYPDSSFRSGYCDMAERIVRSRTAACDQASIKGSKPNDQKEVAPVSGAQKGTQPGVKECTRKGCTEPALEGKRICQTHYDRVMRGQGTKNPHDLDDSVPVPGQPAEETPAPTCDQPCGVDPCDHSECTRDDEDTVEEGADAFAAAAREELKAEEDPRARFTVADAIRQAQRAAEQTGVVQVSITNNFAPQGRDKKVLLELIATKLDLAMTLLHTCALPLEVHRAVDTTLREVPPLARELCR